jgi:hypothetical protein
MNTTQSQTPDSAEQDTPVALNPFFPATRWAAGFEYAFGYQLQLFMDFWGIRQDGR